MPAILSRLSILFATNYYARLPTQKYFYTSFPFGTWLEALILKPSISYLLISTMSKSRKWTSKENVHFYFKHIYTRWWWCYPTPFEVWGRGGTPRVPNSRATPQGLDQRSKMEAVVSKMACRRGSDTGQSRRWVRSCRGYAQAL